MEIGNQKTEHLNTICFNQSIQFFILLLSFFLQNSFRIWNSTVQFTYYQSRNLVLSTKLHLVPFLYSHEFTTQKRTQNICPALFNISTTMKFDWDDFYNGSYGLNHTNEFPKHSINITDENSNVWVRDCFFVGIIAIQGAGIYCEASSKLLIESSTFIEVCASKEGTIYVEKGDCVIHKVCGLKSTSQAQSFCYIDGNQKEKNYVYDSTIAQCNAENDGTMKHEWGIIEFKSVNLSYNMCNTYSFYYIPGIDNSISTNIEFSSYYNNTVSSHCLTFQSTFNGKYYMKNSNIIKNQNKNIIRLWYGDLTMISCVLLDNGPDVFTHNSGNIILINCSASSEQLTSPAPWFNTSFIGSQSFSNVLTFFATGSCLTEPVQTKPYETPLITPKQTPSITPKQTPLITPKQTPA